MKKQQDWRTKKEQRSSKHCKMGTMIRRGAWSHQRQRVTWNGAAVQIRTTNEKEEEVGAESQKRKNVSRQPALEKDLATVLQPDSQGSCRSHEDRQWRFKQNLIRQKAEEIDTKMQIVQLWSKIKKAIQKNRVPCQPLCKCLFPTERDIQWFLNATQAMIKKIDKEAAERRIQNWLSEMKRVLNRKASSKDASKDWKALSNFIKNGRAPPITAVLASDQENQIEGVESAQRTYAVETNEILQQIEAKWEPVFNRPQEANFDEFLARFRNYVKIQQCTIPELTGRDSKRKAKEISSMRSVAMCGWRTQEIKALPEEVFDLFACLFKQTEQSQIWPEILLQVVTTFIPKVEEADASPWFSVYTSLRYEQMENWRNEVMPSSMHGARKGHGVWDVSFEHMLEMETVVEKDQCLGALSLSTDQSSLTASKEMLVTVWSSS